MESTAVRGVWTERLPRGYTMTVDTNQHKFTVYSPSQEEILIVEIPGGIYPRDVERVRDLARRSFKLYSIAEPCHKN